MSAHDMSPVEIEHQIERTRERVGVHLDALGDRLSPGHFKRQARARLFELARRRPGPVAAAAIGGVLLTAWNRRRADAARTRGGFGRLARAHPMSMALVAALVGLALGVMAPDD